MNIKVPNLQEMVKEALKNSDLCLLQRCKDNFLFVAQNKFSNVFDIKHSSNRSLVIGTNFNIEQQKHFELPTFNLLKKHNDPNPVQFQGSLYLSFSDLYGIDKHLKNKPTNTPIKNQVIIVAPLHN